MELAQIPEPPTCIRRGAQNLPRSGVCIDSYAAKSKSQRNETYGEVRWQVVITNQNAETCATYELLTMNAV